MECLQSTQVALYLTTYGLDTGERAEYDRHLAECPECRQRINRIGKRLRDLDVGNEKECAGVRADLEAYAQGEVEEAEAREVVAHVAECHTCDALLTRLRRVYSTDEVERLDIAVPPHLAPRVEAALNRHLQAKRAGVKSARDIAEDVKRIVNEIRLALTPLESAVGFRGEAEIKKSEFLEIEHAGGDIVLDVGAPGVVVELYSNRQKYLDDGESDGEGLITFPGMEAGLYKVRAQGHEIVEVR